MAASISAISGNASSSSSSSSASRLNPDAREWNPATDRPSEANRSLFLTFSSGFPLNESEIATFFNATYGRCVEKVYVDWHRTEDVEYWMAPLFGKVLFRASYYPVAILGGRDEVRFMVYSKPMWCKRYETRRRFRLGG